MLRRLLISLRRDNTINWRNFYYLVTLLVAVIYILTVRFAIPAQADLKPDVYVLDQTRDGRFSTYLRQAAEASGATGQAVFVGSEDDLRAQMGANRNSVGLQLSDGAPLPDVKMFFQGHENEKIRGLLAVAMEAELRQVYGQPYVRQLAFEQQVLRPGASELKMPFNDLFVPFLIFSDAVPVALMFIAALVFMEKEEGTLRAFLVTPGKVWEYLLSKALTLAFLAVLFTLVLVPLTLGWGPNYWQLLLLVALGSIFSSFLGALLAVFFDNFSQFIWVAVLALVAMGIPGIAYWVPSFSPAWVQWIPTYPLIFGLREASFPSGGGDAIVYSALLVLVVVDVVLLVLASMAFSNRLACS